MVAAIGCHTALISSCPLMVGQQQQKEQHSTPRDLQQQQPGGRRASPFFLAQSLPGDAFDEMPRQLLHALQQSRHGQRDQRDQEAVVTRALGDQGAGASSGSGAACCDLSHTSSIASGPCVNSAATPADSWDLDSLAVTRALLETTLSAAVGVSSDETRGEVVDSSTATSSAHPVRTDSGTTFSAGIDWYGMLQEELMLDGQLAMAAQLAASLGELGPPDYMRTDSQASLEDAAVQSRPMAPSCADGSKQQPDDARHADATLAGSTARRVAQSAGAAPGAAPADNAGAPHTHGHRN